MSPCAFPVFGYDNGMPAELTAAIAAIEWTEPVHEASRAEAGASATTQVPTATA